MKKLPIIFLVLIGCIGLISCASGPGSGQGNDNILRPVLSPGEDLRETGRIEIAEFTEKEIVFNIIMSPPSQWLLYAIADEKGNAISEGAFIHDTRRTYIRKMKAKGESIFIEGKKYTLYIGIEFVKNPHPVHGQFLLVYKYEFVL